MGLLVGLTSLFRLLQPGPALKPGGAARSVSTGVSASDMIAPTERRPTYKHSVIPGGAFDAQELTQALANDPVAADHYRDVTPRTIRAVTLTSGRLAHVSYRLGDRVYWTKRPVRIHSGETILTDGQTEIRARCGNCISLSPLLPTSEEEPDLSQLDALTDTGPLLVSWNMTPSGLPIEETPIDLDTGLLIPIFPFGGLGVSSTEPTEAPPGTPPLFDPDSPPDGTGPPSESIPPFIGGLPVGLPGSDIPFAPGNPLVLSPLLDAGLPTPPPTVPTDMTPVPEPATLWLIGSGLAAVLIRRWRSHN